MLTFITGNKGKFEEVQAILPQTVMLDIDLIEIQSLDPRQVIHHKLQEALSQHTGEFIVEDVSLSCSGLNGLPGTLIKWFGKTVTFEMIPKMLEPFKDKRAKALCVIGYAKSPKDIHFFEGEVSGTIVSPKTKSRMGWDNIFLPDGYDKTFAEISIDEKNAISMRGKAFRKLKMFLDERSIATRNLRKQK